MDEDGILYTDALAGLPAAVVVEDYPDAERDPCVLTLQEDRENRPIHVLWGLRKSDLTRAVVSNGLSTRPISVEQQLHEAEINMTRRTIKLVHEGKFAAEVPVDLIEEEGGWSPYLSHEDATKLDLVRIALRQGDLRTAAKYGRVFELKPVAV